MIIGIYRAAYSVALGMNSSSYPRLLCTLHPLLIFPLTPALGAATREKQQTSIPKKDSHFLNRISPFHLFYAKAEGSSSPHTTVRKSNLGFCCPHENSQGPPEWLYLHAQLDLLVCLPMIQNTSIARYLYWRDVLQENIDA